MMLRASVRACEPRDEEYHLLIPKVDYLLALKNDVISAAQSAASIPPVMVVEGWKGFFSVTLR